MSLNPSPTKLKAKTVNNIAIPGKMEYQGAEPIYFIPSLIMLPQLGVGGVIPSPKKLRAASLKIAFDIHSVATTMISPIILGKTFGVGFKCTDKFHDEYSYRENIRLISIHY